MNSFEPTFYKLLFDFFWSFAFQKGLKKVILSEVDSLMFIWRSVRLDFQPSNFLNLGQISKKLTNSEILAWELFL